MLRNPCGLPGVAHRSDGHLRGDIRGTLSIAPVGPQPPGAAERQESLHRHLLFGFLCKETNDGLFATISSSYWGKV